MTPLGLLGTGGIYLVVVALNDFQKERGPVLHGLGEDLQEVAFLIVVHQDFQLLCRGQGPGLGRSRHTPLTSHLSTLRKSIGRGSCTP